MESISKVRIYEAMSFTYKTDSLNVKVPKKAELVFFEFVNRNDHKLGNIYYQTKGRVSIKPGKQTSTLKDLIEIEHAYIKKGGILVDI